MNPFEDIAGVLRQEVASRWEAQLAISHAPEFSINHDGSHGDFSCDLAIELSRTLSLRADDIAASLAAACAEIADCEVEPVRGFLNFTLRYPSARFRRFSVERASRSPVIVLPRPATLTVTGYLRMVLAAFAQAALLGSPGAPLIVGGAEPIQFSLDEGSLAHACRALISRVLALDSESSRAPSMVDLSDEGWARLTHVEGARQPGESAPTVWCAPRTLPGESFDRLCELLSGGRGRARYLVVPSERWCAVDVAISEIERAMDRMSDEQLLDLAVYCASPLLGDELDLAVPLHVERMNLRRWLVATTSRFDRYTGDKTDRTVNSISEPLRSLWVRGEMLAPLVAQSARRGEVIELWRSLDEFLREGGATLNSLTGNQREQETSLQILSGVSQRLSASIQEKLFCCGGGCAS